ncbi:hypothetical protein H5410_030853 [Solanum commersonii]|uniref:Uncharacterized protein n=1 Tax=Solanum commersonii TaxID=4109 RepID=A0A9J5YFG7_SOLCO|nr:hypothetical protein H5410_030853 [Solanum commersonii]
MTQSELGMIAQLQQLSLQLQEFIIEISKNQGRDSYKGRTDEAYKVGLTAFYLLGEAQLWHHQLESITNLTGRSSRNIVLSAPISKTAIQGSEYACIDQQVSLFTADQIDSIQLDIEMHSPPDLVHDMNIASRRCARGTQGCGLVVNEVVENPEVSGSKLSEIKYTRTGPGCLIELIKFDMGGLSWFPFDRARMKFLALEGKGVVNVGVLI